MRNDPAEAAPAFEILSLDVTAGEDVAFAHALLHCGTKEELAVSSTGREDSVTRSG